MALTWIRTHDWDVEAQIETARRICRACQVSDECLEFALATNQEAGIWGGTTEEERRKLRKMWVAKQRAAC